MRSRVVLGSVVAAVAVAVYASTVPATPPSGVTPTLYGIGRLGSFDVRARVGPWRTKMSATRASSMWVLSNRITPGGSFGWHSHPGPSFVIVKSGTATVYFGADPTGADPTCTPHRFRAGTGFVDQGRAVHIVRNEGKVDLVTVVVSFTPPGAVRRIDEADPGHCHF
jgi:hypothetical protein